MKKGKVRDLTHKDLEGSEHMLCYMSTFDKLVEASRVASELYDQHKQNNLSIFDTHCSVDKSLGKSLVGDHQETNKEPFFSSRTCRISGQELLKGARKKCRGETSSWSRCYEYGNVRRSLSDHDDHGVTEKVLGKKRKCCDSKDDDFVHLDVKEKVLGNKRKSYDLKDGNFKKPRIDNELRYKGVGTAPLPVEVANEIQRLGGNDVRLLIQKTLTATDLAQDKNRFNIPAKRVRQEAKGFLTEDEEKFLNQRYGDNSIVGMQVPLLEPSLNRSEIKLKKWPMSNSFWYVLCTSWFQMQRNNHLQVGKDLQVWSFRVNGVLNLAMVKVP
ncbi:uncharacterized protein LOC141710571 [Apium graveolens]|uniref:uncharacterized protein LOC141710571 n=1 Tax=Apium graveolens TaxID=4045 RepID=UPI003D7AF493